MHHVLDPLWLCYPLNFSDALKGGSVKLTFSTLNQKYSFFDYI